MTRKTASTHEANHLDSDCHEQHQFSCRQCGSATHYQVGSKQLACTACGHREAITERIDLITEYSLDDALQAMRIKPLSEPNLDVTCENCGATSEWDIHSLSDLCPYCKTPIAKLDTDNHRIQIEAIAPFIIEKQQAFKQLEKWFKGRWFAPSVLKQMSGHSKQFEGVYIPHWTFDSLTHTGYRGLRGVFYVEYQRQRRMVDGKVQIVEVPVTKTRWYPATGQVRLMFDDVLVLASMLIPKTIINQLRPWRLADVAPYTPQYVAGLKAKYYQLDLDDAFTVAQQKMSSDIDRAIRYDIGGDVQQIHQKQTRHQNSTYKLILLPVWHSAFEYKGKTYKTVINGQTGKIAGQYPKSPAKIAAAVIGALILAGIVAYFYSQGQYGY